MKHLSFNLDLGKPETLIVLGAGRGGTSLAAGTLRCLGVCMGSDPHPVRHEWSPVTYNAAGQVEIGTTLRQIEAMNGAHALWGWKSPGDVFSLGTILPLLRQPAFLVVTRDLVDLTLSAGSYSEVPWEIGLYENATIYQFIASRVLFWPHPVVIVPFHEMLAKPSEFVELLCSYLQLAPTAEQRERAVQFCDPRRNAYRSVDENVPVSISPEDLEIDSEAIAAIYIPRYTQEYLRHFDGMRKETGEALEMLREHFGNVPKYELSEALVARTRHLFVHFAGDLSAARCEKARPTVGKPSHTAATGIDAIGAMLEEIDVAAAQVNAQLRATSLSRAEGYRLLRQYHRIFLLLIAMRTELQKGLHSFAPVSEGGSRV